MEVAVSNSLSGSLPSKAQVASYPDSLVIEKTLIEPRRDKVSVGAPDLSDGLTLTANKIIERLNELLKEKIPDGIQSLRP
ncbi:MAG: hypothetical protein KDD53_06565, partial [Bdellovibrionales bacterium]|nr:hypothetical protein [Bdellovibrionales bacterium]